MIDSCDLILTPEDDPDLSELHKNFQNSYRIFSRLKTQLKNAQQQILLLEEDSEKKRLEIVKLKDGLNQKDFDVDQCRKKYVTIKEKYKSIEDELMKLREFKAQYDKTQIEKSPKDVSVQTSIITKSTHTSTNSPYQSPSVARSSPTVTTFSTFHTPQKQKDESPVNALVLQEQANKSVTPPHMRIITKKSEAGKRLSEKLAKMGEFQPKVTVVKTEPMSPVNRMTKLFERNDRENAESNSGWLNTGKGVKPKPDGKKDHDKTQTSGSMLNLSLFRPGKLKQTNMISFAKKSEDPDETFCTELEKSLNQSTTDDGKSRTQKQKDLRTVSSEDLFEELTKQKNAVTRSKVNIDNENIPPDSEALNTGMIASPVRVKREPSDGLTNPKKLKSNQVEQLKPCSLKKTSSSDQSKSEKSSDKSSNSVILIPTPNNSLVEVEDSTEALEMDFLSQFGECQSNSPPSALDKPPNPMNSDNVTDFKGFDKLKAYINPKQPETDVKFNVIQPMTEFLKAEASSKKFLPLDPVDPDETFCPDVTVVHHVSSQPQPVPNAQSIPQAQRVLQDQQTPLVQPVPQKKRSRDAVKEEEEKVNPQPQPERKRHSVKFTCKDCEDHYGIAFANDLEYLEKKAKECARKHKRYGEPDTPVGFWEIDFPPTEDIKERNQRNAEKHKELLNKEQRKTK